MLAAAAVVPGFIYDYAITITAGLCGEHGSRWLGVVAALVPLLIVGSWGVRHGNWIFVAWPAAVLAAFACSLLVEYVDSGAHGHCETMTPYSRSPTLPVRYS